MCAHTNDRCWGGSTGRKDEDEFEDQGWRTHDKDEHHQELSLRGSQIVLCLSIK